MQSHRVILVLDNNVGANARAFCETPAQVRRQWFRPKKDLVVVQAHLSPVAANCRQSQRRKEPVQIGDWATAHQSQRPVHELQQLLKRFE